MPISARFTNFCGFHDFRKAVAIAFIEISKIPTVNFEIHSFLFICSKLLFSIDTSSCPGKLNLRYKEKNFSAMLIITSVDLPREIFAIDMLKALNSSFDHRDKHVLPWLRLYRDQA